MLNWLVLLTPLLSHYNNGTIQKVLSKSCRSPNQNITSSFFWSNWVNVRACIHDKHGIFCEENLVPPLDASSLKISWMQTLTLTFIFCSPRSSMYGSRRYRGRGVSSGRGAVVILGRRLPAAALWRGQFFHSQQTHFLPRPVMTLKHRFFFGAVRINHRVGKIRIGPAMRFFCAFFFAHRQISGGNNFFGRRLYYIIYPGRGLRNLPSVFCRPKFKNEIIALNLGLNKNTLSRVVQKTKIRLGTV